VYFDQDPVIVINKKVSKGIFYNSFYCSNDYIGVLFISYAF
jgi:hypothetical protein